MHRVFSVGKHAVFFSFGIRKTTRQIQHANYYNDDDDDDDDVDRNIKNKDRNDDSKLHAL